LDSNLKQSKMSGFLQSQRRTGPLWGFDPSGRGKGIGKVCGKANMRLILCTHVCKWKK
jgi:hypothetical protein